MTKRQQQSAINALIAMGVLVEASLNANNGIMYAKIKTIRTHTRTVPLSIAVQFINDIRKRRYPWQLPLKSGRTHACQPVNAAQCLSICDTSRS